MRLIGGKYFAGLVVQRGRVKMKSFMFKPVRAYATRTFHGRYHMYESIPVFARVIVKCFGADDV